MQRYLDIPAWIPFNLGFRLAPPRQWLALRAHFQTDTHSLGFPEWEYNANERDIHTLTLLNQMLRAFPYTEEKVDEWTLALPGDCDEFALCAREMLISGEVFPPAQIQLAIATRHNLDHLVLAIYSGGQVIISDPTFNEVADWKNYTREYPIRITTIGEDWFLVGDKS